MTNPSRAQSPHAVSDETWAEAVRREAVVHPLAAASRLGKVAVTVAARDLGLSAPRVYGLLRAFRRQPVTASLLPTKPGPMTGTRRLAPAIEPKIDAAIEAVYLRPERPTLKRTVRKVRQDCRAAGLTPPSIRALRARISAHNLREWAAARDGARMAGTGAEGQGRASRRSATGRPGLITIQGSFSRDPSADLSRSEASNGA
jgi:putative transposase